MQQATVINMQSCILEKYFEMSMVLTICYLNPGLNSTTHSFHTVYEKMNKQKDNEFRKNLQFSGGIPW